MNTEQKAKAYDKGIEKLRKFYRDYDTVSCLIDVKEELANFFPELRECEAEKNEKVRIGLIKAFNTVGKFEWGGLNVQDILAWLEKQSHDGKKWIYEDDYYRDREQLYQDGIDDVLENPQKYGLEKQGEQKPTLEDAAKLFLEALSETPYNNTPIIEAQIITKQLLTFLSDPKAYNPNAINEQKPANKVEPKFKVGDWISGYYTNYKVTAINSKGYVVEDIDGNKINILFENEKFHHLWTIKDAKDGDVLNSVRVKATIIFKNFNPDGKHINAYGALQQGFLIKQELPWDRDFDPATKERRELLFQKMKEEGYEWDAEKKELKKIEQKPAEEYNDEDYGIDGLYHAQEILERTLGKVDGYQSDDGILEHKCAITAVKKLYEQKSAEWSEEDEDIRDTIIRDLKRLGGDIVNVKPAYKAEIDWLKSLKPQSHWKPTEEQLYMLNWLATNVFDDGVTGKPAKEVLYSLYEQLKQL